MYELFELIALSKQKFSPQRVEHWLEEAVAVFRHIERSETQKLEINFSYQERELNFFRKFITWHFEAVRSKLGYDNFSTVEATLQKLEANYGVQNSHLAQVDPIFKDADKTQHLTSLITIGQARIAKGELFYFKNLFEDNPLKNHKNNIDFQAVFQQTFFHELGHTVSWGTAEHFTEDQKNTKHFYPSRHTPDNLVSRLQDLVDFDGQAVWNSYDKATQQDFSHILEGLGLNILQFQFLAKKHKVIKYLSEEMFADCFTALLSAQLPNQTLPIYQLIENIIGWRQNVGSGAADFAVAEVPYIALNQLANKNFFSHSTELALERLQDILLERQTDTRELELAKIVDLCQECRNYGITAFMYEVSQYSANYQKFLNLIPSGTAHKQLDLFDSSGTEAEIFEYLTVEDKTLIRERAQLTKIIFQHLLKARHQSFLPLLSETSFSHNMITQAEQQFTHLAQFHDTHLASKLPSKWNDTELNQQVFLFAQVFAQSLYRQQNMKLIQKKFRTQDFKELAEKTATRPSPSQTVIKQSPLWNNYPEQPGELKKRLKEVVRKPLEAVYIFKSTPKKFK